MINTSQVVPTFYGKTVAYDADLSPTLSGLDVLAPGGLMIEDIYGTQKLYTFAAQPAVAGGESAAANVTSFPYRLEVQIRKIVGNGSGAAGNGTTGTNIALASLIPLTR
jgi:hypothetical protein